MTTATPTAAPQLADIDQLPTPAELRARIPIEGARAAAVETARTEIRNILRGRDDRLLVIAGPCSIHDVDAALEYADRLADLAERHRDTLVVAMRVYLEKPRSTGGWTGLVPDPDLDGSGRFADGLALGRGLIADVADRGLAVGAEFLDPFLPAYLADGIAWGAIGARTTESQVHRQLVSGLPMPVGFKNGMSGDVQLALDAATVAAQRHRVLVPGEDGRVQLRQTPGNPDGHVILRGGAAGPNFDSDTVHRAAEASARSGRSAGVIVDASHGNSGKDHVRQAVVAGKLAGQIRQGDPIAGVMLESFLLPGRQDLPADGRTGLVRGMSVTDACLGWAETERLVGALAMAQAARTAR